MEIEEKWISAYSQRGKMKLIDNALKYTYSARDM